jgi:hypothetical protein
MKIALAATMFMLYWSLSAAAQSAPAPSVSPSQRPHSTPQASTPDLEAIIAEVERVAAAADHDIGKLQIDQWKASSELKPQMQETAEALQQHLANAIPALAGDLQAAPGVSRAFKLYHDINMTYEFLNSLAEAAGAFGKKEEFESLAADASALDAARQNLSDYIEQAAAIKDNTAPPNKTAKKAAKKPAQAPTPSPRQ